MANAAPMHHYGTTFDRGAASDLLRGLIRLWGSARELPQPRWVCNIDVLDLGDLLSLGHIEVNRMSGPACESVAFQVPRVRCDSRLDLWEDVNVFGKGSAASFE